MLGSNIAKQLLERGYEVVITYHANEPFFEVKAHRIDISDSLIKDIIIKEKPDWVIHTAALTNVDLCETNKELAEKINVKGTKNVIDACTAIGSKLVFVSTSFIFDGSKTSYSDEDQTSPINYYAETKAEGEEW